MNFDIVDGKLVKKLSVFTLPRPVLTLSLLCILFGLGSFSINLTSQFEIWPISYYLFIAAVIPFGLRTELYIDERNHTFYAKKSFLYMINIKRKAEYIGDITDSKLAYDNLAANWKIYMQTEVGESFFVFETTDKNKAKKISNKLKSSIFLM
jgi:hypothetical protein